jgi:putative ABC transport system permease protein
MNPARGISSVSRVLRRGGGLPLVAVVMLAVAVGATTAMFSIVHAVLLRPLPFSDPDRLVMLWGRNDARSQPVIEVSFQDLRDWRTQNTTFTAIEIVGSVNWGYRVTAPGDPFHVSYSSVSGSFFDTLGARPMLGRTFRRDEDTAGAPRTTVLSHDLWRRRFSANPAIVGTAITIGEGADAEPFEVIGVMGPEFRFPAGAELWTPSTRDIAEYLRKGGWTGGDALRVFYALGRLAEGATIERARADLSTIARRGEISRGETDSGTTVVATPLVTHVFGAARPALFAIFGAVATLMLIACANAAGLLLVQGVAREREFAVRLALGAGRWRLVWQLLGEAAILVALAGMLGVAFAWISFDALVALTPSDVPRLEEASINAPVVSFALVAALLTTVLVGLLPAWQLSRAEIADALRRDARTGSAAPRVGRTRKALVVGQLAAALVLLIAAGLTARSFLALMRIDLGFNPENVLTFQIHAPGAKYPTPEQQRTLVADALEQIERVPGVVAAGAIYERPFAHGPIGMDSHVVLEGQPETPETGSRNPTLNWEAVTPGYFRAMDIRILRGRGFTDRDDERAPLVVVVSESLAARLWPGEDPLGKRLRTYGAPEKDTQTWQTVVGVVENARYREVQEARLDLYLPFRQAPSPVKYFVVRTEGEPLAMVPSLRGALRRIDAEVTIEDPTTMERIVAGTVGPWRFTMVVFGIFSAIALAFAAIGLFAVIAYAVKQRTREIGVRVALGAQTRDVVRLLVGEGARLTLAGVAIGLSAAWGLTRLLSTLLVAVTPTDPATFAAVAVLLALASLLAAYLPARKAAAIDPVTALRSE